MRTTRRASNFSTPAFACVNQRRVNANGKAVPLAHFAQLLAIPLAKDHHLLAADRKLDIAKLRMTSIESLHSAHALRVDATCSGSTVLFHHRFLLAKRDLLSALNDVIDPSWKNVRD
jgi:hypothetical protein